MNRYVQLLRRKGLKVTPQRLEIMRYLDMCRVHPDADSIYTDLKMSNPSLSRTTVYNNLEVLRNNGIIQILTISGSELRYDFKMTPHHHFLCTKCGTILDIDVSCPFLEKMKLGKHRIEEVHGYFKGTCADCLAID